MIIGDIIALAKAGYSPDKVKEIMELAKEQEQAPEPKPTPEPDQGSEKKDTEDMKIYDIEAHQRIKELEAQIAKMQNDAAHADISDKVIPEKSGEDILNELMRNYM